jgi:hypothetical protein
LTTLYRAQSACGERPACPVLWQCAEPAALGNRISPQRLARGRLDAEFRTKERYYQNSVLDHHRCSGQPFEGRPSWCRLPCAVPPIRGVKWHRLAGRPVGKSEYQCAQASAIAGGGKYEEQPKWRRLSQAKRACLVGRGQLKHVQAIMACNSKSTPGVTELRNWRDPGSHTAG